MADFLSPEQQAQFDVRQDELRALGQAFRKSFSGQSGSKVLARLATFCKVNKTTHVEGDPYGSAQLEGRRQVYLLIQESIALGKTSAKAGATHAETGAT